MQECLKISVIMPSFLRPYPGSARNRELKFMRAVDSFLDNTYDNKELIIISDGCAATNRLYNKFYKVHENIVLVKCKKQPIWSGNVRQAGLDAATGNIITYLDTDDFIAPRHLTNIADVFQQQPEFDWIYYNERLGDGIKFDGIKNVKLQHGSIGTSSISHKANLDVSWSGCDGYGHDHKFVVQLIEKYPMFKKADIKETYHICHIKGMFEV